MAKPAPDVFLYTDFRRFLADWHTAMKVNDAKFSHRYINERVGSSSAGWFADLLKGRINLTGRFLVSLIRVIGLKGKAAAYFEAMVAYGQSGSAEERNKHLETLLSSQELRMSTIGRDQFEFYGRWYHAALRELLCIHDFDGTSFDDLGKRLVPPITARQAKKSLELLAKLDLVRKDAQGRYRPTETLLKKDQAFRALNLHRYLGAFAEMAMEALLRFDKSQRDISCLTVALSEEGFAEARAELAEVRRKLLERAAKEKNPSKVFQCNLQMFPLSQ